MLEDNRLGKQKRVITLCASWASSDLQIQLYSLVINHISLRQKQEIMYYRVQFALLSKTTLFILICLKNVEKHSIANSLKNGSKICCLSYKANVQFLMCPSGFKGQLVFYMLNIIFWVYRYHLRRDHFS